MKKAVVTVIGQDAVGIIARVSNCLAAANINILDISQTIMRDIFTMMMLVDVSESTLPFDVLCAELKTVGQELGLQIQAQHVDIFNSMHKV